MDGQKLEAKYEVYYKLRDMSDRICKEHGLSVVKNPQRHKTARSVYFAEKNGEPTRYNLMRRALDEALTMSSSWTELSAVLRKKGYVFVCDPYRRYATLRSLSSKSVCVPSGWEPNMTRRRCRTGCWRTSGTSV